MNKYDSINLYDLVTDKYLKNQGNVNSRALEILYLATLREDLTAQSPGVKNNGINDNSNVFELKPRNE